MQSEPRLALGANPVTMNFDQALIAFQQGTVDGQENPIALIVPYKLSLYGTTRSTH